MQGSSLLEEEGGGILEESMEEEGGTVQESMGDDGGVVIERFPEEKRDDVGHGIV